MVERRPAPIRLAGMALGGGALASSSWFLSFLPLPELAMHGHGFWQAVWADRLRLFVSGLPLVCGIALCLWAQRRFREGYLDDRWTDQELVPVRALVAADRWKWPGWFVFTVCILSFFLLRTGERHGLLIYLLFVPGQTAQSLRQLLNPRSRAISRMPSWHELEPIRSEHWGER